MHRCVSFLLAVLLPALACSQVVISQRVVLKDLQHATDMCADGSGGLWVAEGRAGRLVHLDQDAKVLQSLSLRGIESVMGIARRGKELYLCDPAARSVLQVTADSDLRVVLQLPIPCDPVDLLPRGNGWVISDNDNHRLLLFDSDFKFTRMIPAGVTSQGLEVAGRPGELAGSFIYPGILMPHPLADDGAGFYCVDILGGRVQSFTLRGNLQQVIGSFGAASTKLFRPKGVVELPDGGCLISDSVSGMLHHYNARAEAEGWLSRHGEALLFDTPTALVLKDHVLWVLESMPGRVLRLEIQP